jgi:hypothetical protein
MTDINTTLIADFEDLLEIETLREQILATLSSEVVRGRLAAQAIIVRDHGERQQLTEIIRTAAADLDELDPGAADHISRVANLVAWIDESWQRLDELDELTSVAA